MTPETERLFVDGLAEALVAAEDRVRSLEQDVQTLKELLSLALAELGSEKQQNARLMYRLRKDQGRA